MSGLDVIIIIIINIVQQEIVCHWSYFDIIIRQHQDISASIK